MNNSSESMQYLRKLFFGLACITGVVAGLRLIQGIVNSDIANIINAVMLCAVAATMGFAYLQLRRNQGTSAINIAAGIVLIAGLPGVFIRPYFFGALLLLPLVTIVLVLPISGERLLRNWLVAAALVQITMAAIYLLGSFDQKLGQPGDRLLGIGVLGIISILTMYLLGGFHERLNSSLRETRKANYQLERARSELERQVAARTADLQRALVDVEQRAHEQERLNTTLLQQRQTIRELSIPVLPVSNATLVMPLIGELDGNRLADLQDVALEQIQRRRASRVLLDVTGVPVIDSQVAQGLQAVVQAATLLGAEVALVGVRPEVAETIVSLGITMQGVGIHRDLQSAMAQVNTTPAPSILYAHS